MSKYDIKEPLVITKDGNKFYLVFYILGLLVELSKLNILYLLFSFILK